MPASCAPSWWSSVLEWPRTSSCVLLSGDSLARILPTRILKRVMSHEGIRIVDERESRRIAPHKLPREAVDPVKVRVHKSEGTGMEIDWRDGHQSAWTFRWLRDACPCATCHEAREAAGLEPGERKSAAASLLPMY